MIARPDVSDDYWAKFTAWYEDRPPQIQAAIDRCPPWLTYWLKETGQVGQLYSYEEHSEGEATVKFMPENSDFYVFGIPLDSLEAFTPLLH